MAFEAALAEYKQLQQQLADVQKKLEQEKLYCICGGSGSYKKYRNIGLDKSGGQMIQELTEKCPATTHVKSSSTETDAEYKLLQQKLEDVQVNALRFFSARMDSSRAFSRFNRAEEIATQALHRLETTQKELVETKRLYEDTLQELAATKETLRYAQREAARSAQRETTSAPAPAPAPAQVGGTSQRTPKTRLDTLLEEVLKESTKDAGIDTSVCTQQ